MKHQIITHPTRHTDFYAPALLAACPVLSAGIGFVLYHHVRLGGLFVLFTLIVLPLCFLGMAIGCDPREDNRFIFWSLAGLSAFIGIILCFNCWHDLTSDGLTEARVEQALLQCDASCHPSEVRDELSGIAGVDGKALSEDNCRRLALAHAKGGDWNEAHSLWASTISSGDQGSEMRISSYMTELEQRGVSQPRLLRLCCALYNFNYQKEAVYLWRSYFPTVVREDWRLPLETYP